MVYSNGNFTCTTSGLYMINYTVEMSATGGSRLAAVVGMINGIQVTGSAMTENLQSSSVNQIWTNFFIINVTVGQVFSLQFVGSSTVVQLNFTPAVSTETPISASMVILRIA